MKDHVLRWNKSRDVTREKTGFKSVNNLCIMFGILPKRH